MLYEGRIYLVADNDEQSYVLALSRETGTESWRVDRDEGTNWSTPFVWRNALWTELITTTSPLQPVALSLRRVFLQLIGQRVFYVQ